MRGRHDVCPKGVHSKHTQRNRSDCGLRRRNPDGPVQAKFTDAGWRQRHVRDFVVRLCHQYLKSNPHGRSGYAELPQERSQGINADCPAEIKRSHPVFVTAETHQVLRWFTRVLATFDMDDAGRSEGLLIRDRAHGVPRIVSGPCNRKGLRVGPRAPGARVHRRRREDRLLFGWHMCRKSWGQPHRKSSTVPALNVR